MLKKLVTYQNWQVLKENFMTFFAGNAGWSQIRENASAAVWSEVQVPPWRCCRLSRILGKHCLLPFLYYCVAL